MKHPILRQYEMYLGKSVDLVIKEPDATKKGKDKPPVDTTCTYDDKFLKITDHHFEAEIIYPKEGSGNKNVTQTIKIFNPDTFVVEHAKSGNTLILKAGYNTDEFLPIICATQIKKSYTTKTSTDRVLTIICSEAYNVRRQVRYAKTYPDSYTYKQAIDDILSVFASYGVPTGRVEYTENAETRKLGTFYPIMGYLSKSLDKLCESAKLKWYIIGGNIYIQPKDQKENKYINVLDIDETHVKNTPEFNDDKTNKDVGQTTTRTYGVKVKVNLNGNINKSDGIQLRGTSKASKEFKRFEGRYLIESVRHTLSYEGAAWDTTIEARG